MAKINNDVRGQGCDAAIKPPADLAFHVGDSSESQQLLFCSSSLLTCLGPEYLDPGPPHGRPRQNSRLLASAWPSSCCCSHLGSKLVDGSSLSPSAFQKKFKKMQQHEIQRQTKCLDVNFFSMLFKVILLVCF